MADGAAIAVDEGDIEGFWAGGWVLQGKPFVVVGVGVALGKAVGGSAGRAGLSDYIGAAGGGEGFDAAGVVIVEEHFALGDDGRAGGYLKRDVLRWLAGVDVAGAEMACDGCIDIDKILALSRNGFGKRFGVAVAEFEGDAG